MNRDEAVAAIVETGKTPEEAEAFLAILGSAFARRGWIEGTPMSQDGIDANLRTFLGTDTTTGDPE